MRPSHLIIGGQRARLIIGVHPARAISDAVLNQHLRPACFGVADERVGCSRGGRYAGRIVLCRPADRPPPRERNCRTLAADEVERRRYRRRAGGASTAGAHPVAEPGDLWVLGRHRLLCGDSTVATDVARVLGGVAPHLMVTDPPYGVNYDRTMPLFRPPMPPVMSPPTPSMQSGRREDDAAQLAEVPWLAGEGGPHR